MIKGRTSSSCALRNVTDSLNHLGDNCIQNFHLGRYIVRYTVEKLVLQGRASRAIKRDFRIYLPK